MEHRPVLLLLGTQLFAPEHIRRLETEQQLRFHSIVLLESHEISTKRRYHKLKLAFVWACMREYRKELESAGFSVTYHPIEKRKEWRDIVPHYAVIHTFAFADKGPRSAFSSLQKKFQFEHIIHPSPMFLTPESEVPAPEAGKPMRFHSFYAWQRKRMDLLLEDGKPLHGKWSFDAENRKKLPANVTPPAIPKLSSTPIVEEAIRDVERLFPKNPGRTDHFWLPTTRRQAHHWFETFLEKKLAEFGPYEDAFSTTSPFVYHSAISPLLNIGLLTPAEVVKKTLEYWKHHQKSIPYSSLEGFLRQIIGWREYMKIIYERSPTAHPPNYWKHTKGVPESWYNGDTGTPPLDDVLHKILEYGYAHHIERLMILSNYALLHQLHPQEVYRWFLEMFIDAYEWVMYGNVYSMGLYADGGAFTTKPYISSSNYIRTMSSYKPGTWSKGWDDAFWNFLQKHQSFFSKQPRMRMLLQQFLKKKADRDR